MSDTEGEEETKKVKVVDEWRRWCRSQGIPKPPFNQRAALHMKDCEECRLTWPHFYFQKVVEEQLPMKDAVEQWYEISEDVRKKMLTTYLKQQPKWVKKWTSRFLHNGYKLYIRTLSKEFSSILSNLIFKERAKLIGDHWKALTEDQRNTFSALAKKEKACYMSEFEQLPTFKKKIYYAATKNKRYCIDPEKPKKPLNSFFRFKKEYTDKPEHRIYFPDGVRRKVNEESKAASEAWKRLSAEEQMPYKEAFTTEYQAYKEKMKRLGFSLMKRRKKSVDQEEEKES